MVFMYCWNNIYFSCVYTLYFDHFSAKMKKIIKKIINKIITTYIHIYIEVYLKGPTLVFGIILSTILPFTITPLENENPDFPGTAGYPPKIFQDQPETVIKVIDDLNLTEEQKTEVLNAYNSDKRWCNIIYATAGIITAIVVYKLLGGSFEIHNVLNIWEDFTKLSTEEQAKYIRPVLKASATAIKNNIVK
jgi:hypothetical protein